MEGTGNTGLQAFPRKKVKLEHHFGNDGVEEGTASTDEPMTKAINMQDLNAAPEPDKELECGITQFVDSTKQGFSGVLKKRLGHSSTSSAYINLSWQVHGFLGE